MWWCPWKLHKATESTTEMGGGTPSLHPGLSGATAGCGEPQKLVNPHVGESHQRCTGLSVLWLLNVSVEVRWPCPRPQLAQEAGRKAEVLGLVLHVCF